MIQLSPVGLCTRTFHFGSCGFEFLWKPQARKRGNIPNKSGVLFRFFKGLNQQRVLSPWVLMNHPVSFIVTLALLAGIGAPGRFETRDSYELEPATQTVRQIKWPKRTIEMAFSNSLLSPGANIKTGSDVVGAARRALARWSSMTNVNFVVTWSRGYVSESSIRWRWNQPHNNC